LWSSFAEIAKFLCGEGEDIEQVARTSKQLSCVCVWLVLNLLPFISNIALIIHPYMLDIIYVFNYVCYYAYTCMIQAIETPQLLYKRGILRRSSRALQREFDFIS